MGKQKKGKSKNDYVQQSSGRKKMSKKYPKTQPAASGRGKATGRTVGGYSPAKLEIRAKKRESIAN